MCGTEAHGQKCRANSLELVHGGPESSSGLSRLSERQDAMSYVLAPVLMAGVAIGNQPASKLTGAACNETERDMLQQITVTPASSGKTNAAAARKQASPCRNANRT